MGPTHSHDARRPVRTVLIGIAKGLPDIPNSDVAMMTQYYLRHDIMPLEEDLTHEFKGHRTISEAEMSSHHYSQDANGTRRSRQNISKCICGMLNSGQGGIIYCGILDGGQIEGIMLTPSQMDHIRINVFDAVNQFKPQVPDHMYNVNFVPVVEEFDRTLGNINCVQPGADYCQRQHNLRTARFCWCDAEAMAMFAKGRLSPFFVIEIAIEPWNPDDPRNRPLIPVGKRDHFQVMSVMPFTTSNKRCPSIPPSFMADDGLCYLRRNASTESCSFDKVVQITTELCSMSLRT